MDKALKQRLVGATILILLAVIFLPMLMDGPKPESSRVISIDTPDRPEFEFESRRLPLDAQMPDAESLQTPPASTDESPVEDTVVVRPLNDGPAMDAAVVSESPDEAEVSEGVTTADSTDAESDQIEDSPSSTAEPAPAVAAADTNVEPVTENDSVADGMVIQVASLSSDANANRLAGQLQELGLRTSLDTVAAGDGELTRVRVVGIGSNTEATNAIRKIRSAVSGVEPKLLNESAASASTATSAAGADGRWAVQVGSFSNQTNVENLVARLKEASFRAFSERSENDGRTIYKVKVGPMLDKAAAEKRLAEVEDQIGIRGVVVSYP